MISFIKDVLSFLFGWFLTPLFKKFEDISVARAISISFAFSIILGSIPIYLSEGGKLSYINSLYLSASSFCVTGLSPVNISELKMLTQILIIFFVQLGGLGIIVVTVLVGMMVLTGLSRNTKIQTFITELIDAKLEKDENKKISKTYPEKIMRVILSIFNITLTIELFGSIALYYTLPFPNSYSIFDKVYLSVFTCISAFNNAGFSLMDDISFATSKPLSLLIISTLIIFGGIGYPVIIVIEKTILKFIKKIFNKLEIWGETQMMMKALSGQDPNFIDIFFVKISHWTEERIEDYNNNLIGEPSKIQTNIILKGSLILITIGAVLFFILEQSNPKTIGNLTIENKVIHSIFLSISSRTAGFASLNLSNISDATLVMVSLMMFVGGGPQGTAGGIKITTFVILVKYLINVINSGNLVEISGETISKRSVAMAIRLYFLSTSFIAFMIFLLTAIHYDNNKLPEIAFEVVSAFSTVGYSLGITEHLTTLEKSLYILLMYVGRISIFTVLIAITGNAATGQIGEDDGEKIQVG
jgi:trk system potassium uptake protein